MGDAIKFLDQVIASSASSFWLSLLGVAISYATYRAANQAQKAAERAIERFSSLEILGTIRDVKAESSSLKSHITQQDAQRSIESNDKIRPMLVEIVEYSKDPEHRSNTSAFLAYINSLEDAIKRDVSGIDLQEINLHVSNIQRVEISIKRGMAGGQ